MLELTLSFGVGLLIAALIAQQLRDRRPTVSVLASIIVALIVTVIVCGIGIGLANFGVTFLSSSASAPGPAMAWVLETGGELWITALLGAAAGSLLGRRRAN
ncbi:hypothetical protein G3A56_09070 [Rhizobium oryzihabitans]|uniref:Uncharacterized protein n=1 Tax=Rhizobium oryzihabitans TaxID=2267833 RepID=A0A7L5BGZ0_9HYPH|nr:hypothetical protein [Rhizobium oryzihabitans]QIB38121.1 hypothetical protein G3A56_09070 [Rhizobium oryzihabitans]